MHTLWKKVSRHLALGAAWYLPEQRRIALERRLRGREEARKLALCDAAIVSYGKSGRTWLRVMLSRFYQTKYGLSSRQLLGFDNLHRQSSSIPKLFFTHDNYLKDYTGHANSKADYAGHKVILLVRDPRDVAVSQFFQWKYRMRPAKKILNQYPPHDSDISLFDFVMYETAGLPKIIDFLNLWAEEMPKLDDLLLVRYEDLRSDTAGQMRRITDFLETPGTEEEIRDAVEYASVDNMRKLEQEKKFWLSGSRMVPKDKANPHSYKVRRAKVGGWRDYFDDEQVARIEAYVNERLDPVYHYTQTKQAVNA
ncbi:MAG: sulfotransferase domain-containing protein [Methylohalobius crimeensis]